MGYCRVGKDQWMKHVISIQSKGFALRCLAKKDILIPVDTLEDKHVTEKISVKTYTEKLKIHKTVLTTMRKQTMLKPLGIKI